MIKFIFLDRGLKVQINKYVIIQLNQEISKITKNGNQPKKTLKKQGKTKNKKRPKKRKEKKDVAVNRIIDQLAYQSLNRNRASPI